MIKTSDLVNGNVANAIRRSGLEDSDQIRNSIEVNPFTDPLQILEHRLESQNPKPHSGGGEGRHTYVGTNVDKKPILTLSPGIEGEAGVEGGEGRV